MLGKLLTDPLAIFLIAGAALLLAAGALEATDDRHIEVTRAGLLDYIRQQSKDFEPGHAEARLARADAEKRRELLGAYVAEEALAREARRLGFHDRDYIIKRRLVQKVELMSQGFAAAEVHVTAEAVRAHYDANPEAYGEPARFTFAHVYLADATAFAQAEALRTELNAASAPFAHANRYGNRFPYHSAYVDRTATFVAGHFGDAFTSALLAAAPNSEQWQGPLSSKHGLHLVLLTDAVPAHLPEFADIQPRVEADFRQHEVKRLTDEALQRIVDSYEVSVDDLEAG